MKRNWSIAASIAGANDCPMKAGIWLTLGAPLLMLPAALSAQPQAGIIEHTLPTALSHPTGITSGPDGAVWFTEFSGNRIGRMSPAGVLTEYALGSAPEAITVGADGALWFTEYINTKIGRITTAGVITEFPVATSDSHAGIVKGSDGALWFTEDLNNKIGRLTLAGGFSEFAVPSVESFPSGIAAGSDGALWFAEFGANKIGRLSTAGIFNEYVLPNAFSGPSAMTAGPDGAIWFTEYSGNRIGRITTAGVITEYPVPTAFSAPSGIAAGPDGALWFTESDGNRVGRINTAGAFTEYSIPTASSSPWAIAKGHDNALWFTSYDGNRIGQVVIPTAVLTASPDTGAPGAGMTVMGSGFAAQESVKLYVDSMGMNLLSTAATDGSGSLIASSVVPAFPYGYNTLVGVGQTSGALGFVSFSITPRLTLSPATTSPGATVNANGFGFGAGERVDVYWKTPHRALGEATSDSRGRFTGASGLSFAVPANATPGANVVYAVGQTNGTVVYNIVTVQ